MVKSYQLSSLVILISSIPRVISFVIVGSVHPNGSHGARFVMACWCAIRRFYARTDIAKALPYDTSFRYSADVDWCIRVMKEGERRHLLLRNIHAIVADYMQEGQTTLHHKESLQERFEVMKRHYGLVHTLLLHAWFALRSVIK